jgi:hypothetical protein
MERMNEGKMVNEMKEVFSGREKKEVKEIEINEEVSVDTMRKRLAIHDARALFDEVHVQDLEELLLYKYETIDDKHIKDNYEYDFSGMSEKEIKDMLGESKKVKEKKSVDEKLSKEVDNNKDIKEKEIEINEGVDTNTMVDRLTTYDTNLLLQDPDFDDLYKLVKEVRYDKLEKDKLKKEYDDVFGDMDEDEIEDMLVESKKVKEKKSVDENKEVFSRMEANSFIKIEKFEKVIKELMDKMVGMKYGKGDAIKYLKKKLAEYTK